LKGVFFPLRIGGSVWGSFAIHRRRMHSSALRPMTLLERDWEAMRHSPASRTALDRLSAAEPLVATLGAHDLGELVELLRTSPRADAPMAMGKTRPEKRMSDGASVDPDLPAAVVRAMLRSAHVHPLIPRALVQSLAPGLLSVGRRLAWGTGGEWPDSDAFLADAVATAWEIVTEWAGEDRRYAVLDLLSAVRCRLRRRLLRHRRQMDHVGEPIEDVEARAAGRYSMSSDLDHLATAIDSAWGRELTQSDAAVLYAHRVLGYSLTELAALTGRSRRFLGEHRDRATQALTA